MAFCKRRFTIHFTDSNSLSAITYFFNKCYYGFVYFASTVVYISG